MTIWRIQAGLSVLLAQRYLRWLLLATDSG